MLIPCPSGLRLRKFDLPDELDKKQPFCHVTELHLNENLMQPEQVSYGTENQVNGLLKSGLSDRDFIPITDLWIVPLS